MSWGIRGGYPILNPPGKKTAPEVLDTIAYIRAIIENLAGPQLKKMGIEPWIVISSDPGDHLSISALNTLRMQEQWAQRNPLTPQNPLLAALNLPLGKMVCCEVRVDIGALQQLNEGEFAWWLAHELGHLIEGHVFLLMNSALAQDMQQLEAVADRAGLDLFVGKYDLESVLTAFDKLYAKHENDKKSRLKAAGTAASSSHPFEGMRISLLQARIQELRRTRKDAQPLPVAEVPANFKLTQYTKIQRTGVARTQARVATQADQTFIGVVKTHFIKNERFFWLSSSRPAGNSSYTNIDRYGVPYSGAILAYFARPQGVLMNVDKTIVATFELINKSGLSAQRILTASLLALVYLPDNERLSPETLAKIGYQLLRQNASSANPTGSSPMQTLPALKEAGLDSAALQSQVLQKVFLHIGEVNAEWKQFALVGRKVQQPPKTDAQRRAIDREKVAEIVTLAKKDELSNKEFNVILGHIEEVAVLEISPGDLALLKPFLRRMAHLDVNQRSMMDTTMASVQYSGPHLALLISRLLGDSRLGRVAQFELFKFFAHSIQFNRDLKDSPAKSETVRRFGQFVAGLKPAEFFQLLSLDDRTILDDELDTLFNPVEYEVKSQELRALRLLIPRGQTQQEYERMCVLNETVVTKHQAAVKRNNARISEALTVLTMAGSDPTVSTRIAQRFTFNDLVRIQGKIYEYRVRYRKVAIDPQFTGGNKVPNYGGGDANIYSFGTSPSGGLFLLDVLAHTQYQAPNIEAWHQQFERITRFRESSQEMRDDLRLKFSEYLLTQFKNMRPSQVYAWLNKERILKIFDIPTATRLLIDYTLSTFTKNSTIEDKRREIARIEKELNLISGHPDLYDHYRESISLKLNFQPHETEIGFPPELSVVNTENVRGYGQEMRAFNALAGLTRREAPKDQIHLIQYLMGRRTDMPEFILASTEMIEAVIPVRKFLQQFRGKLQHWSIAKRMVVANAFLAGPSSIINSPAGLQMLLDELMSSVAEKNHGIALEIAHALLDSLESSKSLGIAYVLAQKPISGQEVISEGEILRSLFEAFGAAGIKLGQYMGFTSELAGYSQYLAALQDAAMPISYFEMLALVRHRFGDSWPRNLRIVGMLGTGSVNIAIEYEDESGGLKKGVVSLARKDIEVAIREDFRRLNLAIQSLTQTQNGHKKFGFLKGLIMVIERSVTLELNKENALNIQRMAKSLYARRIDGWNVQTIDAHDSRNMALFMDKANGITARKLIDPGSSHYNPDLYMETMRIMSRIEFNSLLGVDESGSPIPVELFANPDFHDGQVLIDDATKMITILDFGQALPITNQEREWAIDILSIIAGVNSAEESAAMVNNMYRTHSGISRDLITTREAEDVCASADRMDIFIKLLALLEFNGFEVPLSSIHWVLGVNRQIELGKKVGIGVIAQVRNMLLARRIGLGLKHYNSFHLFTENAFGHLAPPPTVKATPNCAKILTEATRAEAGTPRAP